MFRKRPKLNYFQGYHDIISVLFLTLPPDLQLACAEKLSLHRVRDSMGSTLEPVLGLLRVTKNLLRLADTEYADILEQTFPLPFHALSNLLTLFSHDMPTLPLIQHVFDYLLCRPPIAVVYLATAVILSRKADVERLVGDDDEQEGGIGLGMAHSLLNALPEFLDNVSETEVSVKNEIAEDEGLVVTGGEEVNTRFEPMKIEVPSAIGVKNMGYETTLKQEDDIPDRNPPAKKEDPAPDRLFTSNRPAEPVAAGADIDFSPSTSTVFEDEHDTSGQERNMTSQSSIDSPVKTTPARSPLRSRSPAMRAETTLHRTPSSRRSSTAKAPTLTTLSSLLTRADALYELYPPDHPGLELSHIMGPQSVVYTWRQPASSSSEPGDNKWEEERLADDDAEEIVARPELVVYPYIQEDESIDLDQTSEEEEEGWGWWSEKNAKVDRKHKDKEKARRGKEMGMKKRRPCKVRQNPLSRAEMRNMLAGAVLVVGIAMAIYGTRAGRRSSGGWNGYGRALREWRRVGSWIGGALVGAADQMVDLKD